MAMPSLFKGLLQSLCRTYCALTTIALVCALVLCSSFLWISAVSSCPFHSVSTLHFHAPPVPRKGLRNMPPIMMTSTSLASYPVLSRHRHAQSFTSCFLIHTIKKIDSKGKPPFLSALCLVCFFPEKRVFFFNQFLKIQSFNEKLLKLIALWIQPVLKMCNEWFIVMEICIFSSNIN